MAGTPHDQMFAVKTHIAVLRFWISNLEVARQRWLTIPTENVIPELSYWRKDRRQTAHCGSTACFGGWVALMPEFCGMGVVPRFDGAPSLTEHVRKMHPLLRQLNDTRLFPSTGGVAVAFTLFGDNKLFYATSNEEDERFGSGAPASHRIVLSRIAETIKRHKASIRRLQKTGEYDHQLVNAAREVNFPQDFT